MARYSTKRLFACLAFALSIRLADGATKCYYPNGKEAPDTEKPCSKAEGAACCPDNWECLDNGLCHYPVNNLYGRYSCTDQSWKSPGCASNMCTYDMKAVGGESITQCSNHDDQWCCNANDQDVKCCNEWPEPRPFFRLQDGRPYATIGTSEADDAPNLASITGLATSGGGGGGNRPSPTPGPSSDDNKSDSPSSDSPTATPDSAATSSFTSVQTSVSSGPAGISTIVQTIVAPAQSSASDPSQTNNGGKKTNIGLIVGLAVGIPLAIALLGILFWLLRKRRHQKAHQELPSPSSDTNNPYTPAFAGGAKFSEKNRHSANGSAAASRPDVPELGGEVIGPGRPVSTIKGKAELDSGTSFAANAPVYGPDQVGLGGGNVRSEAGSAGSSWGSAPPGYSPGMNASAWGPAGASGVPAGVAEAPDTSVPRPGSGGSAGAAGTGYVPYRPGAERGLSNVQEVAEMPTVRTPPEEQGRGRLGV
ncbi:hypothetical protein M011DRAFT_473999 [Sporormia fimetaria CBS 119925]|uniref:Mid2 domain-containing protein n=1 Tax=Sporormia fimetaria CBS 119925 TaxID=1340428 RepID=A0A6A6VPK9_9PLEO|nr:hypothetical protein M011DRAFT_473999 [Sporormia fimetaria CBS 119925]